HILQADSYRDTGQNHQRSINGGVGLRVPYPVMEEKRKAYTDHGKPVHRTILMHDTVFSIVARYESELAGLANYYRMAYNLSSLNHLKYTMETSLTKTLAAKLRISVKTVYGRYHAVHEGRRVLRVTVEREGKPPLVATYGRVSLRWDP